MDAWREILIGVLGACSGCGLNSTVAAEHPPA